MIVTQEFLDWLKDTSEKAHRVVLRMAESGQVDDEQQIALGTVVCLPQGELVYCKFPDGRFGWQPGWGVFAHDAKAGEPVQIIRRFVG